ncbi:MAG: Transcriptional regulatory protein QseB [Luteibacter sp.]|uniref:winged helix-turn-helix domain-containing protein n=1 Tax=Luteibacter sp. TaxID=1886636 RepID=UPI00137F2AE6|nr:winged helix-turn-helix domain-containing protein [Luteibacter sp.]KAF1004642.1 MAG: Transcriptional regulatory protein QseB [Luteibacter sp.]
MYIVLFEEDHRVGLAMKQALERMACTVLWIRNISCALEALRHPDADLVVMGAPGADIIDLLREARRLGVSTPVLLIFPLDRVGDRVAALDAGADECLVKPVDPDELAARVRCLARRYRGMAVNQMQAGTIHMDLSRLEVSVCGRQVMLTRREFAVLRTLMGKPGCIVQRDSIERSVYGCESEVGPNALEVLVHSLRRKLGKESIRTVRGFGYMVGD